ncbi:MAG: 50S ribosomal protein L11 methyltransferase [Chitinophagaceae bacterium]
MATYTEIIFEQVNPELADLLIALLSEQGFTGFEENENSLHAFIPADQFNSEALKQLVSEWQLSWSSNTIEETNWNQLWESSFHPVLVDDFVAIRADFHAPVTSVTHELVITPKMSFGTGHHATTFLMIRHMRDLNWTETRVLDFGTGTGVLAILAHRLGAGEVLGIDNDPWSIENARENLARNQADSVGIELADVVTGNERYDIILANINKHIILDQLQKLKQALKPGGQLLVSGILLTDEADINMAAAIHGLRPIARSEKDNWLCISFS